MKQSEIIKKAVKVFPECETIRVVVPYEKTPKRVTAVVNGYKIIISRSFWSQERLFNDNFISPWAYVSIRTKDKDQPYMWCYGVQNKKEICS